ACSSSGPTALQLAREHPDGLAAARYVSIGVGDLPRTYKALPASGADVSEDASQTLAEYKCEMITGPTGPILASYRSPEFENKGDGAELHVTTTIFGNAESAAAHLALEENPRYPGCKAAIFKRALVASASPGESVGFVTVKVTAPPPRFGDSGVQVVGLSSLTLAGGVSTTATSDLTILARGPIVCELSAETYGASPGALLDKLTALLATRLAQVAGAHPAK
ncbi:MAG: hypothetical protein WAM97_20170, partial [Acidimicrobiales bacterium]